MDSNLQARTFGSESPPYDDPQPLLTWTLELSEEELQEIRSSLVEKIMKRYDENGISNLITMSEYLSDERDRLRRLGNEYWNRVSHLQGKVSGGSKTKKPTKEEEKKFDKNVEKAGSMNRKADKIEYKISILKNIIWKISVQGKNKIENSEKKEDRTYTEDEKKWMCLKYAVVSIHEDEGIENILNWESMYISIKIKEGKFRGIDAIRKQMDRRLDQGRPENLEGMIEYAEKWSEDEEIWELAQRYIE
ncbi:hypothetical protein [Salinibacter ruber]|uniref:Uncharacterized protein n=1 Tax=Salinibacter ruber TaxID=146919 RepID=A0A9X2Q7U3_9BACT|nr:hypothetical protein [Salinibacter ruber]MCS3662015.1 hypothetical protein [Salinibacter ruber]MCS3711810.1 hypothetical protein [Salinibacter ruber]MCS4119382.1 hypothetical protein [Salinibacter ruber]MCS4142653.1 hypothetical protein [Salinibacter ruber]